MTVNRPDGQTVTFNYDNAGRLSNIALPQGTVALAYDPAPPGLSTGWTPSGKLTSIVSPDGQTLRYQHDGPLTTKVTAEGPAPGVIDLQYDTNFWVTSRKINGNDAGKTLFQYDRDGLITKAADVQVYRDPNNAMLLGAMLFGTGDVITRSDLGELQHYEAGYSPSGCASGGAPTAGCDKYLVEDYQRDHLGRITQMIETTLDSLTASAVTHTYTYTYDITGRLTAVQRDGAAWETYAYDGNGNRISWTDVTGSGPATYDSQDRLLAYADKTYTYTLNGELQTKTQGGQTSTYSYGVLGNLRHVGLASGVQIDYLVDGANRRIGKKVNGTLGLFVASGAASDGLLFGLALPLQYNIAILVAPDGLATVAGATAFPSLEVWQYGGKNGPQLIYFYDAAKAGTGPTDILKTIDIP